MDITIHKPNDLLGAITINVANKLNEGFSFIKKEVVNTYKSLLPKDVIEAYSKHPEYFLNSFMMTINSATSTHTSFVLNEKLPFKQDVGNGNVYIYIHDNKYMHLQSRFDNLMRMYVDYTKLLDSIQTELWVNGLNRILLMKRYFTDAYNAYNGSLDKTIFDGMSDEEILRAVGTHGWDITSNAHLKIKELLEEFNSKHNID